MAKKKPDETFVEEQIRILKKASPILNRQIGGDFTKVATAERRQILLRAAPHARQPSVLWTKDRKVLKKFYVKRYLEFLDQFECEFADRASRILGEVDRELDLAGSNDIYLNIRCEESTLFFHLPRRAISSRNGLLLVRIPAELYEVQRRAQLRYRTNGSEGFSLTAEALTPWQADLSVLDLSSGGVGIQIRFATEALADAFALAPEVRTPFHLDLGVFAFQALADVRYFKRTVDEFAGDPVVRIGLRFFGLPQDTVEAIQLLVLERSYVRLREMFTD